MEGQRCEDKERFGKTRLVKLPSQQLIFFSTRQAQNAQKWEHTIVREARVDPPKVADAGAERWTSKNVKMNGAER